MKSDLQHLAELSIIDQRLDELQEDFGDLPHIIKKQTKIVNDLKNMVSETENILEDVKKFKNESKLTLNNLKERQEKLSAKQFSVRNNKEFDAITKEIEGIKEEFLSITDELRTVGIKEENLIKMLNEQQANAATAEQELKEKEQELEMISSDQNEDLSLLKNLRKERIAELSEELQAEYDRIRNFHPDAIVGIKRNSCTGCFSALPAQKIVEIRNNMDKLYFCENCGRILYPPELQLDSEIENL